ncbi:unnamed protein product [Rhodiola kirilowii]
MDDWEDQPVESILEKEPLKKPWDDEDLEDNDVKDSWEDFDEPAPEPAPAPEAKKVTKKAEAKKAEAKATEKKEKVIATSEPLLDPVAEKMRQQRLVEESDYRVTTELFGKKDGGEKSLDNFIPKSESDFLEYAELIAYQLRPYENSYHYIGLLKAVMRLSMKNLKAADAKEVASSCSAVANEKLKAEKEVNASKNKGAAKKKQLHVDKPDDDIAVGGYDPLDDYDFM